MALKKYHVTKDIYHKGKLIKQGSVVVSETNHKYFEPYVREEFSDEKEPASLTLKEPEGIKYTQDGVVVPPKGHVTPEKRMLNLPGEGQSVVAAPKLVKESAPKAKDSKSTAAAELADADNEI